MKEYTWKNLIDGEAVAGEGPLTTVYNPSTGDVLARFQEATAEQALYAAQCAKAAFARWSTMSLNAREAVILRFIELLREHRREIIDILVAETGKPMANAQYDFDMLPDCLNFFMNQAKNLHDEIIPDYDGRHMNMVIHKPLGVVVGYLAWNFPILNLGYKLGPILASGCTCLLKPATPTPLATMYIGQLSREAGFPDGVINIVAGRGSAVCKALNESDIPAAITLIGSTGTGRQIIRESATSIKHYSLELGGNAPVLVMKDADVDSAAALTADLKFGNAGQVCVCANRIFVHKDVKEQFVTGVLRYIDRITLGCGNEPGDILMGPMVSAEAQQAMQDLVEDAVSKGARILCGGKKASRPGYFFEPTVLDHVTRDMRVYQEEIFGPIMPIIDMDSEDDSVVLANDTQFGLAAYLFTKDLSTALKLSRAIHSGNVCVNEPFYCYNLPHGGCKQSGVGKDCSHISLEEYYYLQRISIKL